MDIVYIYVYTRNIMQLMVIYYKINVSVREIYIYTHIHTGMETKMHTFTGTVKISKTFSKFTI